MVQCLTVPGPRTAAGVRTVRCIRVTHRPTHTALSPLIGLVGVLIALMPVFGRRSLTRPQRPDRFPITEDDPARRVRPWRVTEFTPGAGLPHTWLLP